MTASNPSLFRSQVSRSQVSSAEISPSETSPTETSLTETSLTETSFATNSATPIAPAFATGFTLRDRRFTWGTQTYVMGILNVTPDSFSDGGEFTRLDRAVLHATAMAKAGVDWIDIGGQSTRPGAVEVTPAVEQERVLPVIAALRKNPLFDAIPLSIDTYRASVAAAAIAAGADLVNDVTGGNYDPMMLSTVATLDVPYVLMHMRGTPKTMQSLTNYANVVAEVGEMLREQAHRAIAAGIAPHHLILDPGIGFAKTYEQNLELLRNLPQLKALGYPLLLGVSRKSFIGKILNREQPRDRVWGTAAACTACIAAGADILRVHDVGEMADVRRVADALYRPGASSV